MYQLILIPKENQEVLYPAAWHFLKDAYLDGVELDAETDLLDRIKDGSTQLWVLMKGSALVGAVATEVWGVNGTRAVRVPLAGGEIVEAMEPILDELERFAKLNDAVQVVLNVRPGIAKLSRAYGYRTQYVDVRKRLSNG